MVGDAAAAITFLSVLAFYFREVTPVGRSRDLSFTFGGDSSVCFEIAAKVAGECKDEVERSGHFRLFKQPGQAEKPVSLGRVRVWISGGGGHGAAHSSDD